MTTSNAPNAPSLTGISGISTLKSVTMKGMTRTAPTARRPMLRFSDAISVVRSRVASSQAQTAKPASWNKASSTA